MYIKLVEKCFLDIYNVLISERYMQRELPFHKFWIIHILSPFGFHQKLFKNTAQKLSLKDHGEIEDGCCQYFQNQSVIRFNIRVHSFYTRL